MQLWIDGKSRMPDGNINTRRHHRLSPMVTAEMRVNRGSSGIRTKNRHSAPPSTISDGDRRDESQSTFIRYTNALSLRRLQVDGLATHRPTTCGLLRSSLRGLQVDGLATHRPTTCGPLRSPWRIGSRFRLYWAVLTQPTIKATPRLGSAWVLGFAFIGPCLRSPQ